MVLHEGSERAPRKERQERPAERRHLTAIGDQRGDQIATVGQQEGKQAGGCRHRRSAQEDDRGAKAPVGEEEEDERKGGEQDGGLGEQREPQQAPRHGDPAAVELAHRQQDQPELEGELGVAVAHHAEPERRAEQQR